MINVGANIIINSTALSISNTTIINSSSISVGNSSVNNIIQSTINKPSITVNGINITSLVGEYCNIQIFQLPLSSTAYNIGLSYSSKSFATGLGNAQTTKFSSNGSIMYCQDYSSKRIAQYTLTTPWDISTASAYTKSFIPTEGSAGDGFFIKPDGTKMYFVNGTSGNPTIYQYTMSTAWDISTCTYDSKSFNPIAQVTYCNEILFSPDGTKLYASTFNPTSRFFQYTLSTAWDVSTASYASKSYDASGQGTNMQLSSFNSDGTMAFSTSGSIAGSVFQYRLSTAYDISTVSLVTSYVPTQSTGSYTVDIAFSSNGLTAYLTLGSTIYQYSTTSIWLKPSWAAALNSANTSSDLVYVQLWGGGGGVTNTSGARGEVRVFVIK